MSARTLRIAHATDIHWMLPPALRMLTVKRFLGSTNLFQMGRSQHFSLEVQTALVDHLVDLAPDVVVITGDLTAQALPEEFALARRALEPVLSRFPTFVIPGNHDAYVTSAVRDRLLEAELGAWMHLGADGAYPSVLHHDGVMVVGLDPNRVALVMSSGRVPEAQLDGLRDLLSSDAAADAFRVLCLHYPVLDRRGDVYDGRVHGLRNAKELISLLGEVPHPPHMICHGHIHHGFTVQLQMEGLDVPIFNPGSSGYAFQPAERRAAGMNLYTVEQGQLAKVERYLYSEQGFALEPGGAYATGR